MWHEHRSGPPKCKVQQLYQAQTPDSHRRSQGSKGLDQRPALPVNWKSLFAAQEASGHVLCIKPPWATRVFISCTFCHPRRCCLFGGVFRDRVYRALTTIRLVSSQPSPAGMGTASRPPLWWLHLSTGHEQPSTGTSAQGLPSLPRALGCSTLASRAPSDHGSTRPFVKLKAHRQNPRE